MEEKEILRNLHILIRDPARQGFVKCDQEVGVVDRVVVFGGVPLKCDRSVPSSPFSLVEDTLRKTFGNKQIVPERESAADDCRSGLGRAQVVVRVSIALDRVNPNDTVDRKNTVCTAPAHEAKRPRCSECVVLVIILRRRR